MKTLILTLALVTGSVMASEDRVTINQRENGVVITLTDSNTRFVNASGLPIKSEYRTIPGKPGNSSEGPTGPQTSLISTVNYKADGLVLSCIGSLGVNGPFKCEFLFEGSIDSDGSFDTTFACTDSSPIRKAIRRLGGELTFANRVANEFLTVTFTIENDACVVKSFKEDL